MVYKIRIRIIFRLVGLGFVVTMRVRHLPVVITIVFRCLRYSDKPLN